MAVKEPEPPDPSILSLCASGLGFLNVMLAARLNAPEFAEIPRDRNETVAAAWLKFIGYYVSLAKATGPMGALAGAIVATAYAYAPPAFMAMVRENIAPQAPAAAPAAPQAPAEPFVVQPA